MLQLTKGDFDFGWQRVILLCGVYIFYMMKFYMVEFILYIYGEMLLQGNIWNLFPSFRVTAFCLAGAEEEGPCW